MTVELSNIRAARETLAGIIIPTPIFRDNSLSDESGAELFLKAECLQKGGSFKVRGAYNKINRLTDEEKSRGVIAPSVGNHAQGVALAARFHGIKAKIIMPEFAPLTKIRATRNFGAEVILHGENFDAAAGYARELCEEEGLTYVHAFDDDLIIAGQGTIGLEIFDELPDANTLIVPIGGGGLISGIAIAVKSLFPKIRIIGVQAENYAPVSSLLAGKKRLESDFRFTIADGIAVKQPADRTLEIIREHVDEIVSVSEDEIARGIYHCVQNNRLVVEGAGAAGLAAFLAGKVEFEPGDKVCAVLCGGNIDANQLARVLEQVLVREGRYIFLNLLVMDRPGGLANLVKYVAKAGANIVEIYHRRAMYLAPLGRVGIELLLEVRDDEHGREVHKFLKKKGYTVEREGQKEWEQ